MFWTWTIRVISGIILYFLSLIPIYGFAYLIGLIFGFNVSLKAVAIVWFIWFSFVTIKNTWVLPYLERKNKEEV